MTSAARIERGQAEAQATCKFAHREAPFAALPETALRDRLLTEALRLRAAIETLIASGPTNSVRFSRRSLTTEDFAMHGRSEAALHRWELAGDDAISRELLAQLELTPRSAPVLPQCQWTQSSRSLDGPTRPPS